jgi:hypothetical protein
MAAAVGGCQLRCYIACHQLITKSFPRDRCFKICSGPSANWSQVLKMKKLLNDGLDLTRWPRAGKKQCEQTQRQIYAPDSGFRWPMCQRRHLSIAFETACGPLGPEGRSLMENTPFGGFSAGLRRPNQLAAVAEIWFSVDRPPYSPNLNLLDFSNGSVLRPKSQATPHANLVALRLSVAAE